MSHLATQRLLQASASLAPADRALLNLWVNRGLDDEQLAELTGMNAEAVRARRDGIVSALSLELHLPEPDVRATIGHLEPGIGETPAVKAQSRPEPKPEERVPRAVPPPPPEQSAPAAAAAVPAVPDTPPPPPGPADRRRRLRAVIGTAVVAAAVIIVAVVLLVSGSSHKTTQVALSSSSGAQSPPATSSTTTSSTASTPTTSAAPTAPTAGSTGTFAALPGGLKHSSGSVVLTGSAPHLKLRLTVRDLPAVHGGHYEAWLFSSVVDSRALGKVPSGSHTLSFPLPAGARGYHLIDISFQPTGVTAQSGESKLQARNPVDGRHHKATRHHNAARPARSRKRAARKH